MATAGTLTIDAKTNRLYARRKKLFVRLGKLAVLGQQQIAQLEDNLASTRATAARLQKELEATFATSLVSGQKLQDEIRATRTACEKVQAEINAIDADLATQTQVAM